MSSGSNPQQIAQQFQAQIQTQAAQLKRPTVLVCGYCGTGKTSLIRSICGPAIVSDDRVQHGKRGTTDFMLYENDLVRFWDSMGFEPGQKEDDFIDKAREFVRREQADPDVANHIHLVWYCIQGCGARVTESDKRLIRDIFDNVIVLVTKNDITRDNQRLAIRQEVESAGVAPGRVLFCSEEDQESLKAVVRLSVELLPDAFRAAWVNAQLVDLDLKKTKAQVIIHTAATTAAAAGAIPLPISDASVITPTQIGMIVSLAYLYGFQAESIKAALLPVVMESAGIMTATSLVKLWPGLGSVIQGGVAGAVTEGIGQLTNQYLVTCCEARLHGRPLPTFHLALDRFLAIANPFLKKKQTPLTR